MMIACQPSGTKARMQAQELSSMFATVHILHYLRTGMWYMKRNVVYETHITCAQVCSRWRCFM